MGGGGEEGGGASVLKGSYDTLQKYEIEFSICTNYGSTSCGHTNRLYLAYVQTMAPLRVATQAYI